MLCRVATVRLATPGPPVAVRPRPVPRVLADFPAAMSACIASISAMRNPPATRPPSSGLIWLSIRLVSEVSVDPLIGRFRRPRMRPERASVRYQSQSSATVKERAVLPFAVSGIFAGSDTAEIDPRRIARLFDSKHTEAAELNAAALAGSSAILKGRMSSVRKDRRGRRSHAIHRPRERLGRLLAAPMTRTLRLVSLAKIRLPPLAYIMLTWHSLRRKVSSA